MLKKVSALCMATIMALGMAMTAFAAEPEMENVEIQRTDGYTYWKVIKNKIGEEDGPYKVISRGPGGDEYEESHTFTVRDAITSSVEVGIKKAIVLALNLQLDTSYSATGTYRGTYGGKNYDANKTYELRAWPVYDVYSIKGKEYTRIDGYEVATGASFGYSGDKDKAKTAKKYRTIEHNTFPVIK